MLRRLFLGSLISFALSSGLALADNHQSSGLKVDTEKSQVSVTFRQMNVSVDAVFNKVDIVAQFDPKQPEQARAMVLIDTASFDFGVGAEEYNEEVRAPDWFHTEKFPTATFEGLEARASGDNRFEVIGKLTIKGVSQDVSAPFELKQVDDVWLLEGQIPIKRLDFNIGQGDWKDTSIVENDVIVKFKIVADQP